MTAEATPARTKRRWFRHPALRWTLLVLALIVVYRFVAVYRIQRSCGGSQPAIITESKAIRPRALTPNLSVMSFNIEGHAALIRGDHLEEIARTINELKPDVVGLQEVHRFTWQSRFQDQALRLGELTGMNVAFSPSYRVFGGDFGNAVLTRGKILRAHAERLPTIGEPRTMLIAEIELDHKPLTFVATHLAAWRRLTSNTRHNQIACLQEQMHRMRGPWILVGDFNDTPDTPEIARLLNDKAMRLATPPDVMTHRIMKATVDFIFHSPDLQKLNGRVVNTGISDHWPLTAEFSWK